ncbi:hypothetical protein TNCV_518491 [Trichonephila clavipes]|nr:hypothetical protein TNCV_518491 [Trichonephila clavipes]
MSSHLLKLATRSYSLSHLRGSSPGAPRKVDGLLHCCNEGVTTAGLASCSATKSSKVSATTQTDENITKIKCPPLKLLQQPTSLPKPNISPFIPSTSASSAQAYLLTSTSPIAAISESEPVYPIPNNVLSTSNISAFPSNSAVQLTSASTSMQDTKQKAKT